MVSVGSAGTASPIVCQTGLFAAQPAGEAGGAANRN